MGKLFKLKKWLTVPDAANHLSIVLGETVNEADILRLALDEHLKLSVDFVNHAQARYGRVVTWDETEWSLTALIRPTDHDMNDQSTQTPTPSKPTPQKLFELFKSITKEDLKFLSPLLHSLDLGNDEYLNFEDEIKSISGVWDLMMVGNERLDVEHLYQFLTDGPAITLSCLEGVFVTDGRGTVCNIQEDFDDNEFQSGSSAQLKALKERIVAEEIQSDDAAELLSKHKQWRTEYLEKRKSSPRKDNYYPAGGLPSDSVLVVRTEALNAFVQSLEDDVTDESPQASEKPLHNSERRSAAQIMSVLASMANLDISSPYAADEVLRLEAATAGLELPASPETVVKFLRAAADSKNKK